MKCLPAFLLFVCMVQMQMAGAQLNFIKGKIISGETGAAIPNASVFITNTSKGTVSNSAGTFELLNVPEGTYDLVVSCISYETQVYTYKASQLPLHIQVQLKPKAEELQAVVIEPYDKDGWAKWGTLFTDNFIGTSDNARKCRIKNYKALRFRNSKKRNLLTVTAQEPLIIENKALGYRIQYQLEGFSYNFQQHVLLYFGFTLFNDLNGKAPVPKQIKNRELAYRGSIMHFMRSLYQHRLAEEGFEITKKIKVLNAEKEKVQIYLARQTGKRSKDSAGYFKKIMDQQDSLEVYTHPSADSLLTSIDTATKKLFFSGLLSISCTTAKENPEYLKYTHENRNPWYQRSEVFLLSGNPVTIDAMGNYYMPQDFMSYGYWSWSEKISNMLPLDYNR